MREIALICSILLSIVLGYFIMGRLGSSMDENRWHVLEGAADEDEQIKITAETPALFDSIAPALEHCPEPCEYMRFFSGFTNVKRLLQRLSNGSIDIALLSEENAKELDNEFACIHIHIPYRNDQRVMTNMGFAVYNMDANGWICVVWNKTIRSKARDRVIFAIENEYCLL